MERVVARLSGGSGSSGGTDGPVTQTVTFNKNDIGLPDDGTLTLVITGDGVDVDKTGTADADGNVTFEIPGILTGTEITVTLTVKSSDGTILYKGTNTQTLVGSEFIVDVKLKGQFLGSKAPGEALAVGDIVFNDGSAEPYSASLTLTDEQAAAAVAVIYDASGKGVGLKQGTDKCWAANSTAGQSKINELFARDMSGSDVSDTVFAGAGATDGSGSLATLKAAVSDYSAANYSAWAFVEGYATTAGLTGEYASGWYMPSITELCKLTQARVTVNSAMDKISGASRMSGTYWSSSQGYDEIWKAWTVRFLSNRPIEGSKESLYSVRVIRVFP